MSRIWSRLSRLVAVAVVVSGTGLIGAFAVARPAVAAVAIQRVTQDGIEAWLVEEHSNPLIAVSLAFRGGAVLDPAGKEGLATLAMSLLDEGAGPYKAEAFKRRLEDLSIRLSFDADADSLNAGMLTLSQHRQDAFELLRMALSEPRFDADAIARVKSQLQAGLRQDAEDPDTVASRRLFAEMFPDSPYGRPTDGTPETIGRLAAGDLRSFVHQRLARGNLVIAVVGDITPDALATLLRSTFGALPATPAPAHIATVPARADGSVTVIDMKVPQSSVVFGQQGILRDDPRFYAATVLNEILGGGGLTSVLFDEVREQRGLVYSVYSALAPYDHAALWMGGAGTRNERVAETVEVIRSVWRQVAENGVQPQQVADAKTYLTGSFPLRFTSSQRLARLLVATQLENLGIDYLDRRNSLIEAVSVDDVNHLAHELLKPDSLRFVVVGQPRDLKSTR
ncbi:MAG: pitrilysin family protein [Rhodospirillales bacterium]